MGILARSESRAGYAVRVLAVHTSEGGGTAQALRDAAWWTGSSHAIADKAGTLLTPAEGCVPYDRAAWTLRSGNRWSENIELIGYAKSTRAQWLADEAELNACARWLASRSKARGIPLVKLTPQQYRAGQSGVIGHHDHTVGYSDGTHWDPGPDFPWDVVLDRARRVLAGGTPPTPAPVPELGDLDMHVLRDPNSSIWFWTPISCKQVTSDKSPQIRSGAVQKMLKTGGAGLDVITDVTWAELDELVAEAVEGQKRLAFGVWAYVGADGGGDVYARLNSLGTAIAGLSVDGVPVNVEVPDEFADRVADKLAARLAA